MLSCEKFYNILKENGIQFYTGVPDSLLKDFCGYIATHIDSSHHVITANEGGSIALAAGYHLATGTIGLAYMQNAGQGNAVNPLISLTDPRVYSIPILLLIGWRGEPGQADEPQHMPQGSITLPLLETLDIPYEVLPDTLPEAKQSVLRALHSMQKRSAPYALVVRNTTFEPFSYTKNTSTYALSREDAVRLVIDTLHPQDIIVATTGKLSRELFEYRKERKEGHEKDFLIVGSMGHASQLALGIAMAKPKRSVYCLDGDGSVVMHMGSLAIIGTSKAKNVRHVVFNNGVHDSVGGQPTVGFAVDMSAIARACGYVSVQYANTAQDITKHIQQMNTVKGPAFLEICVRPGARKNLSRPTITPTEMKQLFMNYLNSDD
jgi:phosphonopyruvate decarboxylase